MKKNGSISHTKNYFSRNKLLILAVCLAFILKLGLFISFQPWNENVVKDEIFHDDAAGYHNLAISIVKDKNFSGFRTLRTPGYPVFIAVIYMVFGKLPWVVFLFQMLINCVSMLLVYKIGKNLFNEKIASLGSILFAIDPHQILYTVHLLAETLFVTTFLASIYTMILGLKSRKGKYILMSGFLIGISTLIKPISQYLPFVFVFFILLHKKQSLLSKMKISLVYLIVFFMTLSPWMIRNYINYDSLFLCSVKGHNLLHHHVPTTKVRQTGKPFRQIQNDFLQEAKERGATYNINGFKRSKIYTEIAVEYIKNNKFDYSISYMLGILNMYKGSDTWDIAHKLGMEGSVLGRESFYGSKTIGEMIIGVPIGIFLLICYLTAFYGIFCLIKEKRYSELTLLLLILIYFSLLTGVVGDARYKIPITPFYLLIAGIGISRFRLKKRQKIKTRSVENI